MPPSSCAPGTRHRLFVRHAAMLMTVADEGDALPLRGERLQHPRGVPDGSVVVALDGTVEDVGPDAEVAARHAECVHLRTVDLAGAACIVPGLCDAHTHPVWAGSRVGEYCEKLAGATYMEIHAKGRCGTFFFFFFFFFFFSVFSQFVRFHIRNFCI
jgi:imidazolonepropionase